MINPYVIIALIVAWIASLGGAFWFGADYKEGQQAKQEVLLKNVTAEFVKANQDFTDTVGLKIAKEVSGIHITNRNITTEVHHEREIQTRVLDNPDCNIPATTWSLLNRARGYGADRPGAGGPEGGVRGDAAPALPAPGR